MLVEDFCRFKFLVNVEIGDCRQELYFTGDPPNKESTQKPEHFSVHQDPR